MTPPKDRRWVPEPATHVQESIRAYSLYAGTMRLLEAFEKRKLLSVRVLFDRHAVVHFVDAEDLRVAAVGAQLVVFAHDQRLDRLGGTHLGAQPAEAAAGEVEVEVIEHLDLLPRLTMAAERDQVVRARLRALVADDAGLGARAGLGLEPQHATKARRGRPPLGRILKRKRRLRRVLHRQPQALGEVDQEDRLQEFDDGLHV